MDALTAGTYLGVTLCSIGSGSFSISVTCCCEEGGTIEGIGGISNVTHGGGWVMSGITYDGRAECSVTHKRGEGNGSLEVLLASSLRCGSMGGRGGRSSYSPVLLN